MPAFRPIFMLAAFWLAVVCDCQMGLAEEFYQVGAAKIDITPDYPIRLNGFGFRREESAGVSQRIWATTLAIGQQDKPPLVLIAIDSLGVRLSLVDEVASRLKTSHGIPRENISLTFSHSHCTPKVNGAADNIFAMPIPDEHQKHIDRYTIELTDKIQQAAAQAIDNRKPARLEYGLGDVGFAQNRRTANGPVDHDLPVLVARNAEDEIQAVYVSYACHCVTLSFNQLSGDWAGYAQEMIARKFPGAIALVSIGCGSDANPDSGVTGDKTDIAAMQGSQIADEVARLVQAGLSPVKGDLTAKLNIIDLPLNETPSRQQLEDLAKAGGYPGHNAVLQLARLDNGLPLATKLDYPVQSYAFGDSLCMLFLSGEVCADYALRLKQEINAQQLWINGYSNDFTGYIPSERLLKEGGYGGGAEAPIFVWPTTLKTGVEQLIVDEAKRQVPKALQAEQGTQGVQPKSPEQALRSLQTHDRFRVELVAAEPLVADPVAIDFGPDGRLWVAEMADYARGVDEEFKPTGRVRFLEDTDGDGNYDRSTVFLNDLRFPTDVKVWRGGVLVCDAPDILFAEDTSGDGQADVRRKLFSGFATHNPHARVNSLRLGLDNWIYGSCGLFGGSITSFNGKTLELGARDFRMHPDTGEIEAVAGNTQQGRCRDDWGNWFGCDNGTLIRHYPVFDQYARRNPFVAPPATALFVPDYPDANRLYPLGGLVLFKLSGQPGRPTSAGGLGIYCDNLLGEDLAGNSFTCEPVNQLVHRLVLSRKGATMAGRRAEEEASSEFLRSQDQWFRPVQMRTGPDGAIWIVDMYRYVIEHPRWIPDETRSSLNVFAGQDRGRIYRILPRDGTLRKSARLDKLANRALAAELDTPNGTRRDLVQQMLLWRGAQDVAEQLEQLASSASLPQVRLQAMCTLDGLGLADAQRIMIGIKDTHPGVRRHAIRIAEKLANQTPAVLEGMVELAADPELEVRLQLAYSLGECQGPRAAKALAKMLAASEDVYLTAAIYSSLNKANVGMVLAELIAKTTDEKSQSGPHPKLEQLIGLAASLGDASTIFAVMELVTKGDDAAGFSWRCRALTNMLDALDNRQEKTPPAAKLTDAVNRVYAAARKMLSDPKVDEQTRLSALGLVVRRSGSATKQILARNEATFDDVQLVGTLLQPSESPAMQQAAITAIGNQTSSQTPRLLLDYWPAATPQNRQQVLETLFSREAWLPPVLNAIEADILKRADLDARRRSQLLDHPDEAIRALAAKVLGAATSPSQRQQIVEQWREVSGMAGDASRGRNVFRERCAACHRLGEEGFEVGPDLSALTRKSPASLLVSILDPSRDLEQRYVNYLAETDDGLSFAGLLVSETGTSITLREPGGKERQLLRNRLEMFTATGKSVMPDGLEQDINRQAMADVIELLMTLGSPPKQFVGNTPAIVKPAGDGLLALHASNAEIYGGSIIFETDSPFKNIGYWHGKDDRASWKIELPKAGKFDIWLDYACHDSTAGNEFQIEGAEPLVTDVVVGTGGWDQYAQRKLATVSLPAGRGYITVRPSAEIKPQALFDLRSVYFVPAGTEPEWDKRKPR